MTRTIFTAQRIAGDGQSQIARWFAPDGAPLCYCLEPGLLRQPHPGIPAGTYALRLADGTPKSRDYALHYGDKFGIGWHRGIIQLVDVPGRDAIEFHAGNTIADTEGCSLAGENFLQPPGNGSGHFEVVRSRAAYERAYPILRDAILAGETSLQILDEAEAQV